MNNASLQVTKTQGLSEEQVCLSETTSPGTLRCEVADYTGHTVSYVLKGTTDGFTYTLTSDSVDFSDNFYNQPTPVAAALVFLTVAFMGGTRNYGTAIMLSVAGVVVSYAFGFLSVSVASLGGLVVVGLFYIFLNKYG